MTPQDRVLCIDDDLDQCRLLEVTLSGLGYAVQITPSPASALDLMASEPFDALVIDLGMGEMDRLTGCERIRGTYPDIPMIVLIAQSGPEAAIGTLRSGAYDFLTKPIDSKLLGISVTRAAQYRRLRVEVERLHKALGEFSGPTRLEGDSPAIKRVNDLVLRVGASEASVLIHGETGTGKELVARALHAASPRKDGPFVILNCAAMPPDLLESELFGHARGAFPDARNARQGLFVEASGGTLFLDEIGEIPLNIQARLLRVFQERTVRPVSSNSETPFDVRIVTATHRDLENDVREKRFRQDLFYRLTVVRIDVPPLRERGSDVLMLASSFLAKACERSAKGPLQLGPHVAERLLAYDWPGNVSELENCIERAVALARSEQLTLEDLPEKIRAYRADRFVMSANDASEIVSLDELERRYIVRVIQLLGGNKARAAQVLGVDRRTLYRKLERYESHSSTRDATGLMRSRP
jgi:DNA-binding NtrC family response regulator